MICQCNQRSWTSIQKIQLEVETLNIQGTNTHNLFFLSCQMNYKLKLKLVSLQIKASKYLPEAGYPNSTHVCIFIALKTHLVIAEAAAQMFLFKHLLLSQPLSVHLQLCHHNLAAVLNHLL